MFDQVIAAFGDILSAHGPAAAATAKSYAPGDYSIHFFLQLAVILVACRVVGWLGKRLLGQPQVVGEMIAGVVLGPSLLGLLLPEVQGAIFPKETRNVLYAGAQLGVGLYMFLVGTTLRLDHLRSKARNAAAVSFAGIAAPFGFAVLITPWLLSVPGLFAEGISQVNATLFTGGVHCAYRLSDARADRQRAGAGGHLARHSVVDRGGVRRRLLVVRAGDRAGDLRGRAGSGGARDRRRRLYAAFLLLFGVRLLAPLGRIVEREGEMSMTVLGITLALFCLSAFLMDAIGIHAIFGGFALGACMPRGRFADELRRKVEPLTVILLLPMFFTYSGLNTRMDTVTSPALLLVAGGILLASIAAKFGACWLAARLVGEDNRTALGIGALMNSRGLMEADHHQHRAAEGHHRCAAVRDAGADGDRDDDDGGARCSS